MCPVRERDLVQARHRICAGPLAQLALACAWEPGCRRSSNQERWTRQHCQCRAKTVRALACSRVRPKVRTDRVSRGNSQHARGHVSPMRRPNIRAKDEKAGRQGNKTTGQKGEHSAAGSCGRGKQRCLGATPRGDPHLKITVLEKTTPHTRAQSVGTGPPAAQLTALCGQCAVTRAARTLTPLLLAPLPTWAPPPRNPCSSTCT